MDISQNLQAITPEKYVHEYRNLPESFMCHRHGLYFDACNKDETVFVKKTRETYRYIALWLEYYLLNQTGKLFEASLKPQSYFKPFAEFQMDYLKLVKEVYLRSDDAQINYPSPLSWLFLIQIENCKTQLENSGYLRGKPIDLGKSKAYEEVKASSDELEDVSKFHLATSPVKVTPIKHLLNNSLYISQQDCEFKTSYWYPFLDCRKRLFRKVKNSPLYVAAISGGKTEIKTNGKRGKKKQKGFG
ncbi:MAG: hypothetical protein AAFY76_15060 [Cyanobacteria bacterium J06649_11]